MLDWFRRRARPQDGRMEWNVLLDGGDVVADDGRGGVYRAPVAEARSVRIVPLTGGSQHAPTGGWQLALARSDGDVLLGKPMQDWQIAQQVARLVCDRTGLPLDELTQRLFSRVSQYSVSPSPKA